MYGDDFGYGYWPPFYDPSPPNPAGPNGMPAYVLRPVTTMLSDSTIGTVLMPVPCFYL
jgi:hypothetical protein